MSNTTVERPASTVDSGVDKVIEVSDLKKHYGSIKAVDGISFHVRKGQVFTLLGPNGAGKTTTVGILEGLKEPDSGDLTILGKRCKSVTKDIKDRMGVLLQETRFIDNIKVGELVGMFASFFSRSIPTDDILEKVSLKEKAGELVESLSGGQRQRLAIGIALVNDPDIIYMDEPTTGLDPQARRNIWDLINELRADRKTIFLTTHYMEEAERLSDYVYIMDHGKIISHGTPQSLIDDLGQENIIEFAKAKLDDQQIKDLETKVEEMAVGDDVIVVFTQNLTETLSTLMDWGKAHSVEFENLSFRRPNLEDVFLTLTGKGLRD